MRVKQIKPEEVIEALKEERNICCVTFGKCDCFDDARVLDLQYNTFRGIKVMTENPDNLFFEEVKR